MPIPKSTLYAVSQFPLGLADRIANPFNSDTPEGQAAEIYNVLHQGITLLTAQLTEDLEVVVRDTLQRGFQEMGTILSVAPAIMTGFQSHWLKQVEYLDCSLSKEYLRNLHDFAPALQNPYLRALLQKLACYLAQTYTATSGIGISPVLPPSNPNHTAQPPAEGAPVAELAVAWGEITLPPLGGMFYRHDFDEQLNSGDEFTDIAEMLAVRGYQIVDPTVEHDCISGMLSILPNPQ